jgi:hypothetical protein
MAVGSGFVVFLKYDITGFGGLRKALLRWSNHRFCTRFHNHNILYRTLIEKMWNCNVSPRF